MGGLDLKKESQSAGTIALGSPSTLSNCSTVLQGAEFFEQGPDCFLITDLEGTILAANSAMVVFLGQSRKVLHRRFFGTFLLESDREIFSQFLSRSDWPGHVTIHVMSAQNQPVLCDVHVTSRKSGRAKAILFWTIREQEKLEKLLEASETKYRRLHESMMDAFAMIRMDGRFIEFNDAFCQFTGYEREELLSMTYEDLTLPKWHAMEAQIIRDQVQVRGYSDIYEKEYRRKDGSIFPVELRTILIRDTDGQPCGMWAIIHDITERKQAQEVLKQLNADLERRIEERMSELVRSNTDLARIAYVASHDLQEPLRMVASYVQLLDMRYRDKLDDDGRQFIAFAIEGALRMQTLIKGLLDYSQIDGESLPIEPVDCKQVLDHAIEGLRYKIKEFNAEITHDPLPVIFGDSSQILRVFLNLIDNAIKFRKESVPPLVHISAEAKEGNWVFCVRDNGMGVESQYFDRIFVLYQRLHPKGRIPGTGLGLAIVKRIVEHHGGQVWVESRIGEGTAIYFSIPMREGQA